MNIGEKFRGKAVAFIVSLAAIIAATVIIIACAISCGGGNLKFKSTYYFVCYAMRDNSVSASSISSAVSEYGGAGYILEYDDKYYVTVACYYTESDAEKICDNLKKKNLNCSVLKIEKEDYALRSGDKNGCAELYRGNLNTLNSLSSLAYECANALDTGEYNQNKAASVVSGIKSGLKGLLSANPDNCFTENLRMLCAVCDDVSGGYIYSKDMRRLQIAIADVVINAELY